MEMDLESLVLVSLAKGVSAIDHMDNIKETSMYKGIVKKEFNHFRGIYNTLTKGVYDLYYDSAPKQFEILVADYESFYYEGLSDKHLEMTMLYAKLSSIQNDLKKVRFEHDKEIHSLFAVPMISAIERMLNHKFWNQFLPDLILPFIASIDKRGEAIYMRPEDITLNK